MISTANSSRKETPHPMIQRRLARTILAISIVLISAAARAQLRAGYGVADITPPKGTPSAGYGGRGGRGMAGVHDPCLATALALDTGKKRLVFCGVDHLGMLYEMIQEAAQIVHAEPGMADVEVYVGSSHTHAGGGGFMNIPGVGFILAGRFIPEVRQLYLEGAAKAMIAAVKDLQPAKAGIGYGHAPGLNHFRSSWPPKVETRDDVAVLKVVHPDGSPLACLFNFAAHPTVLSDKNMEFSADFVGYARNHVHELTGGANAVFFQGAQADISPGAPPGPGDGFAACDRMGKALAEIVKKAWDEIQPAESFDIQSVKEVYQVDPKPNSQGMLVKLASNRPSEINLLVINGRDAIVTIPGELSTIYDADIKRFGGFLEYNHVSIFGLTNDAHGYIITPEAWRHKTYESSVSFGGQMYGELVKNKVHALLDGLTPAKGKGEGEPIASEVLAAAAPK